VRRLPQAVRRPVQHDAAHAPTLGRQAVRVRRVLQVVHQKAPLEDAHELPHGRQAVLVRQVRAELQPEQQHENAPEKVQRSGDNDNTAAAAAAADRRGSSGTGRSSGLNDSTATASTARPRNDVAVCVVSQTNRNGFHRTSFPIRLSSSYYASDGLSTTKSVAL